MKIIILKETLTTIDNFTLKKFKEGMVCDVRESVGCRLIARGDANLFTEGEYEQHTLS